MKRIKIMGATSVAVLALGAMTASAASAATFCKNIKGNWSGEVTLGQCHTGPKVYGASFAAPEDLVFGGTLAWTKIGGDTEFSIGTIRDEGQGSCKKNNEEEQTEGEVFRTETVPGVAQDGEPVRFDFCVDTKNDKVTASPGHYAAIL